MTRSHYAKLLWIALLFTITTGLSYKADAQIPASSYGFTAVSGTFTEITGGAGLASVETDDDISGNISIGFPFTYCGNSYNQLIASSNGWLSFGAPTYSVGYNDQFGLADIGPGLLPLWEDLSGDQGTASYVTTGTAPNRIFTIQFKDWLWTYSGSSPAVSFQVKLYETTNVIEYIYRQESGAIDGWSVGATIGICDGAATPTYLNLNNASPAPTASSSVFTSDIGTKPVTGQIYRFTPPPNCAGATFPVAGPASVSPASVCLSGTVNLSISTAMPVVTNLTYQWQSSPTGAAPWTSVTLPGNFPSQSVNVSAPLYFRCRVLCNSDSLAPVWISDPTPQVIVNNPGTATGTGAARCGPGTLQLTAVGTPSGPQLKWYTESAGGAPIGAGSPWTTPFIPVTDTFYVTAGSPDVNGTQAVGAGLYNTNYDQFTPFCGDYGGFKHQYLILPSELAALGITPGTVLTSLAFDVINGGTTYNDFTISLKNTGTTAFATYPSSLESGAQVVKTAANHTTTAGINTFAFNAATPFVWDGSTLMVQTCWSNNNSYNTTSEVKYDDVPFNASQFGMGDMMASSDICDNPPYITYMSYQERPRMIFGYTSSCQGPRVPVVATINPSPGLTVTAPEVVCHGATAAITVTPQGTPYTTYSWTPATDIYTDAAATIPYVPSASATSLYFTSADAGAHIYYLFAQNTTTGCNHADTVHIWNQPGDIVIDAIPDTICNSGSSTMNLVPAENYFPGSIQWQESADGLTYNDIPGADASSYTTPLLTNNQYYKVLIKAGAANCETPEQLIVVAHPVMLSTKDSFNCGPGVVTLEAEAGGFSNVKWYTSPTATQPIGAGSPFQTPYLGATTTYYAAASSGTPQPDPTIVGNGTSTSSWTDVPYNLNYWGSKNQWLITASSLQAAGFNAGYISSIGFDVGYAGDAVENLTLKMKATTLSALVPPFETNMQTVFSAAYYQPVGNTINVHNLDALFYWDGTSNIILEECHNNSGWGSSSEVTVDYSGSSLSNSADVTDQCTNPGGTTYSNSTVPNVQIGMVKPCESGREQVTAYIHPVPEVDLGPDINICVDQGQETVVLDAGTQPNGGEYLWDDGSTSEVRAVHQNGNYAVTVTNDYGCSKEDIIQIIFRHNPAVDLGNDTSVCNGVVLKLNAGPDGIDYFWNTGATTASIDATTAGTYNVFVTNNEGCTKADTIQISMSGQLPTIQGINITNNGINTFDFSTVNPQNIVGFEWDFGDGSPHTYGATATHQYASAGNYIVTLHMSSTCGFATFTTSAHILGINQLELDNAAMTIYPNPTRETATILNRSAAKMQDIAVYNVLGQIIYSEKADTQDKHTLTLEGLASGVYTVFIRTDKGNVTRKLEIIR